MEQFGIDERRRFNDDRRHQVENAGHVIAFVCECRKAGCSTSVLLTPEEYDLLRPGLILDPTHEGATAAELGSTTPVARGRGQPSIGFVSAEVRALQTMERVLATLTRVRDGDEAIARLAASIERDRAELLAALVGSHAVRRLPTRVRNPVSE